MAHRQHGLLRALFGGGIQDRIEQRQQRDFAFERVALGAEIARLENLFENFSANEQSRMRARDRASADSDSMRCWIHRRRARIGDMHELGANRAAIDLARGVRFRAGDVEFGQGDRLQIAQRIEIRLKVSPAAEGVPDALLGFGGRCGFDDCLLPAHKCPRTGKSIIARLGAEDNGALAEITDVDEPCGHF